MALDWASTFPQWPKRGEKMVRMPRLPTVEKAAPEAEPIRGVSRKVRPHLTKPGHHAFNMKADITDMILSDNLSAADRANLQKVLETSFIPSTAAPDGLAINLTNQDRNWRVFIGIRNRFIAARIARIAADNAELVASRLPRRAQHHPSFTAAAEQPERPAQP